MNEQAIGPYPIVKQATQVSVEAQIKADAYHKICMQRTGNTREHTFTVDACGGDAELICVLQKVMAKFCEPPFDLKSLEAGAQKPIWVCTINPAAVAEWFYAKYGPTR